MSPCPFLSFIFLFMCASLSGESAHFFAVGRCKDIYWRKKYFIPLLSLPMFFNGFWMYRKAFCSCKGKKRYGNKVEILFCADPADKFGSIHAANCTDHTPGILTHLIVFFKIFFTVLWKMIPVSVWRKHAVHPENNSFHALDLELCPHNKFWFFVWVNRWFPFGEVL